MASIGESELHCTLDRLVDLDLLFRSISPSGTVYTFKHELVRDAAYQTLLFAQRRNLHQQIAKALEVHFPETLETQPELLAEHWERADAIEPAIKY